MKKCDNCNTWPSVHEITEYRKYISLCDECALNYFNIKEYEPPTFFCSQCGQVICDDIGRYSDDVCHYTDDKNRHFCCSTCAVKFHNANHRD